LSGDREKYIEAGMDNYISKPIELEKLQELISKYSPARIEKQEQTNTVPCDERYDFDVLICTNLSLVEQVNRRRFEKLGFQVDSCMDAVVILDKLEEYRYRYVLYDGNLFADDKLLIYDIIIDADAMPIILTDEKLSDTFNVLRYNATLEELKKYLF
jgi:DNA-binding response OmpR family regulator